METTNLLSNRHYTQNLMHYFLSLWEMFLIGRQALDKIPVNSRHIAHNASSIVIFTGVPSLWCSSRICYKESDENRCSITGLFVAAIAYLSYKGWVDVKWVAMEDASRSTLTNASEHIVNG